MAPKITLGRKMVRLMQWRESFQMCQLGCHLRRHKRRLGEPFATVNHAMGRSQRPALRWVPTEPLQKGAQRCLVAQSRVRHRIERPLLERCALMFPRQQSR